MIKNDLDKIAKKYYNSDEEYYSFYYYDEEDKEFDITTEFVNYFEEKRIKNKVETIQAFDSCGYSCDVLTVSWIEDNDLKTYNILLECM